MNVALLFFLLLVPLSGFIAWAGDRIGHKSGKRRHSLFGLRPRHTATLITVAAGMCIALVSFGLMWASNASFREILARGAQLAESNEALTKQNDDILRQVNAKRAEIDRLDRDVQTYRQQAQAADGVRRQAEAEYHRALHNSEQVKTALADAERTLVATRSHLGATETALTAAQRQVALARQDLHRSQQAIADAERRRGAAEAAQKLAQADTARAQTQLAKAEQDFTVVTTTQADRLKRQRDRLKLQSDQIASQQQDLASLNTELATRRTELDQSRTELDQSRKDLDALRQSVQEFRTATTALRGRPITYRIGEEVDRVSIPAGISVWRIEFVLDSLLNSAGKKAEARGALRIAQTERAVALAPRPDAALTTIGDGPPAPSTAAPDRQQALAASPTSTPGPLGPNANESTLIGIRPSAERPVIAESDLIRAAAEAIRRYNKDVVVIAVASANAVAGEPVPVDIRTFHNPVVLTSGTTVGEVTVDGTASRQEIVDALYSFLHNEVRERLLKAGVIPTLGGDDAGNGSIVTLSGDAWLKILDDIRRAGSRARVIVRVDRTTRAADPVALRFDVKRSWDSQDLPRSAHQRHSDSPARTDGDGGSSASPDSALR